jgi:hypothetical protein
MALTLSLSKGRLRTERPILHRPFDKLRVSALLWAIPPGSNTPEANGFERSDPMINPRAFVQTMIALASASLGLVAALAWNEAIKATLARLGLGDSLAGLYAYALIATAVAVLVLIWLGKLAARVGGEATFTREAEG